MISKKCARKASAPKYVLSTLPRRNLPNHRERWEVQICIVPPYGLENIRLRRKLIIAQKSVLVNIFIEKSNARKIDVAFKLKPPWVLLRSVPHSAYSL